MYDRDVLTLFNKCPRITHFISSDLRMGTIGCLLIITIYSDGVIRVQLTQGCWMRQSIADCWLVISQPEQAEDFTTSNRVIAAPGIMRHMVGVRLIFIGTECSPSTVLACVPRRRITRDRRRLICWVSTSDIPATMFAEISDNWVAIEEYPSQVNHKSKVPMLPYKCCSTCT